MITNNTSINDLPPEILKYTLSFFVIDEFDKVSLICSKFEKIAKEVIWDGILNNNNTFYSRQNKDTGSFFHIVDRNYFPKKKRNLLVYLFNLPVAPTICKLKIIDYAKCSAKDILPELKWKENEIEDGLIPKNINFQQLEKVPFDFISRIHVSDKNTFKEGELVALIKGMNNNPTCCFGKIAGYHTANRWWVKYPNSYHKCMDGSSKASGEIGKFPKDCELPSFCSM